MKDNITIQSNTLNLNPQDIQKATEWEELVSLWTISAEIDRTNQWYKGDIASRVETIHGEDSLKKFAQEVGESAVTMQHYRRVSRAFPNPEMREWNLSWTHYFLASLTDSYDKGQKKFTTDNRFKWLEQAHDNNWNTSRLGAEIKKQDAIIANKDDLFIFYTDYLSKARITLLNIERTTLKDDEKDKLLNQLLQIYNEFQVYIKE